MYKDKILMLGLPLPKPNEKQTSYIKRVLLEGIELNTRICRFIGIGNLHSIISDFKRSKFPFELEHKMVIDPVTDKLVIYPVNVIWMTLEQRTSYKTEKVNAQPKPSV